jgi:hypothetical protein
VVNCRPISILKSFYKIFESITHDHLSFHFKFKLHPNQRGFLKSKSTATNLVIYLNDVTPSFCSQGQFDSVYFDLSQAFDKVPHALLLNKLNQFGLSSSYVKWFQSYLLNRSSFVRILGKFSSPFSVLSGVPQGSTLCPLLFNIFVNDLSAIIKHSKFLLFADDLKIYRNIKSVEDCKALQADICSVQHWCAENLMELNIQKMRIISFMRKTNSVHFNYYVSNEIILLPDCSKDLGVMLDSKLYFHRHVDFVYSQALRTLGLIRYVIYNFSSLDCLVVLYNSLIKSKLEYASVIWYNLSLTDSNKVENIQRKFANICCYRFLQADFLRNYNSILNYLNFRTLHSRRHLDALFRINVFKGKRNCPSILDSVGICVPTMQIR